MGIVMWAVAGLIAGFVAGKVMKNHGGALIAKIITGGIGGLVGGYLSTTALHLSTGLTGINPVAVAVSFVIGAFLVVLVRLVSDARNQALDV